MVAATRVEAGVLATALLTPNPWNPNVMSEPMFAKELRSITEFGFVDPITVMPKGDRFLIIDGEHRWRAAQQLGISEVPVTIVHGLTDHQAMKLTPILNGLRGEPDETKLRDLLRDLLTYEDTASLLAVMPMTADDFNRIAEIEPFDWDAFAEQMRTPAERSKESWVERTYRMPAGAAGTIDAAIARIKKEEGDIPDWKALELLCADALAM